MGTAIDRLQLLRDNVGAGHLEGNVEVNQRYAANQHYHAEYDHPLGGKAYYMRDPLYAGIASYAQHLAEHALSEEGRGLADAMMDNMEHLSNEVYAQAPWEFADLRASGHPKVTRNGETIHDRAPHVHRLTDEELRDKDHVRRLFGGS